MPNINRVKLCHKHGFYNAIENDRCPDCKRSSDKTYDKALRAKDRQAIYNSKKWKQVRELAILRANFLCEECLRNGVECLGEEVDHIIELRDRIDLAYDLDNLQYLCKKHHREKTEREKEKRRSNLI
jgi:5-methylcytosine-specific restriction protein A